MHRRSRTGFTLVELLIVMLIIGLLMAMLFPAVQAAREAARNASSKNNLRQIALGMHNFESARGSYPASWLPAAVPSGTSYDGWSIHSQLLPYLEQGLIQEKIDYTVSYNLVANVITADGASTKISALRVPVYVSPAEPRDEVRFEAGVPKHYPLNYAVNLGTWLVWDPATGTGGDGAAYPGSKLKARDFVDGLSNTLAFSEVKSWQAYYRNAGISAPVMPTSGAEVEALGGEFKNNSGHTEWVDGRAHQIGFTTVFPPNRQVLNSGGFDVDWTNWQEGRNLAASPPNVTPTYAAVTARSYFPGMVNVALMDGSVRAIQNDISLGVWRALGSRNGKEILPDSFHK